MDSTQIENVYAQLDPELWLVTVAHGDVRDGLIATGVARASIVRELPRQLVAIDKRHFTHELIEASGALAMHLIDETQLSLVWRFGLQSGREVNKFADLSFRMGMTGSPLLRDALGWFDCRVVERMDSGDRTVFLVDVVDGRLERNSPPLTERRLFQIAPPDKKEIMDQHLTSDSDLDAEAILKWRHERGAVSSSASLPGL